LAINFLGPQSLLFLVAFSTISYVIWRNKGAVDRQWVAVTVAVAIVAIYFPTVVEKQNILEAVQSANKYNCSLAYNRDLEIKNRITYGLSEDEYVNTFVLEPYISNLANLSRNNDVSSSTFELLSLLHAQNNLIAILENFVAAIQTHSLVLGPKVDQGVADGYDIDYLYRNKKIATDINIIADKFFGEKIQDCEEVSRLEQVCGKLDGQGERCWSLTPTQVVNLPEGYYHL
jgi:hypothetical protein